MIMCGSKVVTVEPTLLGFASLLETKNCNTSVMGQIG